MIDPDRQEKLTLSVFDFCLKTVFLRLINIAETNTMLMRSDIKKATIQNVLDVSSVVSTFRRLSVQKRFLDLINYNRKNIFLIQF